MGCAAGRGRAYAARTPIDESQPILGTPIEESLTGCTRCEEEGSDKSSRRRSCMARPHGRWPLAAYQVWPLRWPHGRWPHMAAGRMAAGHICIWPLAAWPRRWSHTWYGIRSYLYTVISNTVSYLYRRVHKIT